jgi:hypothetical protein
MHSGHGFGNPNSRRLHSQNASIFFYSRGEGGWMARSREKEKGGGLYFFKGKSFLIASHNPHLT